MQPRERERVAKKKNDNIDDKDDNGAKKSRKGSEIVEGSRCSRVNGRGWRCCQQTLVGYSLCEHHLGKGRLRSVNAAPVRNRRMGESTKNNHKTDETSSWDSSKEKPLLSLLENVDDEDDDDDERKKPSMMGSGSKKRMKLGMVKARSMSSLLGQTDNLVAAKAAENEDEMRVN